MSKSPLPVDHCPSIPRVPPNHLVRPLLSFLHFFRQFLPRPLCCCQFAGGDDVATAADASKPLKRTTSSLDAREVVVVGDVSKWPNRPPPACVWARGR
jgi:hypothetical protein